MQSLPYPHRLTDNELVRIADTLLLTDESLPLEWQRELISQTELFLTLHDRLPKELIFQRELLISRL